MNKEPKNRSIKRMVAPAFEAKRINHIRELCDKQKPPMDKKTFVDEVGYATKISRTTLEKVYNGATVMDYDIIEKLAWYFGVGTEDILESKFK